MFKVFSYVLRACGVQKQVDSSNDGMGGIMDQYFEQSHLNRMVHRRIVHHTVVLVLLMLSVPASRLLPPASLLHARVLHALCVTCENHASVAGMMWSTTWFALTAARYRECH